MGSEESNLDNEIKQITSKVIADQLIANEGNKITKAVTVGLVNILYAQLKESGVFKEDVPKEQVK